MQEKHLEASVEQAGTFTDIIRSNFKQIYDRYFYMQNKVQKSDASCNLEHQGYQQ